ncbi:MAG: terminase [Candidatus Velthaea sp.]
MLPPKQLAFLAAYALTASVTKAAKAAKLDRTQHYDFLLKPEYAEAFARARESATQALEDEAIRRAYEGVDEPTVYKGEYSYPLLRVDKKTGKRTYGKTPIMIRKYSDALLQTLLKGFAPAKYGTKTVEISGPGGGPIEVTDARLSTLNDDELAGLISVARKFASAGADGSGTTETGAPQDR